ncbi:MAG: sigma 54-interacting transcriptional regulator [Peptococcaceae bacterium]
MICLYGKICFIAPYQELVVIGNGIKKDLGLDIDIKPGNLEKGVAAAREAQKEGARVLISRGGTATAIRNAVDIPVVEIKVTGYDLLQVLYPYREASNPVGIAGYQNVVYGCRTISELLRIPTAEYIFTSENVDWAQARVEVARLIAEHNLQVVIGDTVVINHLNLRDKEVKLITSGSEAVLQAVEEARHILKITADEKEKRRQLQAVLDFVHDGVIVTDENGRIALLNPVAEEILQIKKEAAVGKSGREIIPNSSLGSVLQTGNSEIGQIQETTAGHILSNTVPIKVNGRVTGVVATFQEVARIQDAEHKIRRDLYRQGFVARYKFNDILTCDANMRRLIEIARDYAGTDATILIEGESGTGKEMLGQGIHLASPRRAEPFIAVNCAALPPQLLESELFGYEEGAFTGAKKGGKCGLFELAHNGTIFLDEIGEMAKELQAGLLRVLEERQVMRLGSDKIIPVNIRVIAAANVPLQEQMKKGLFRTDLFYRLNVLNLRPIPLRERKGDIEYLAGYFLRRCNEKYGRQVEGLSSDVISFLKNYPWPGNIRELKNVMERIVLSAKTDYITLGSIALIINELRELKHHEDGEESLSVFLSGTMNEIKGRIVRRVLAEEGYNKSRTAKRLKIDRSTLERYL